MLKFATTALNAPKVEILKNITPANYNEAKQEWLEQAKKGHFTSPKFVYHADVYESKVILNALVPLNRRINSSVERFLYLFAQK